MVLVGKQALADVSTAYAAKALKELSEQQVIASKVSGKF